MKSAYSIIQTLLLTEKTNREREADNRYCFKVATTANKLEIKQAVEKIFKVKVLKVNTFNRKGKLRRERTMKFGRTAASKRALVTLQPGDKIEIV
ncbi:MAG: 50S ribosomal protein L23 [Kiritimatiellia bacterium]